MATYWVKSGTGGTDTGASWTNAAESITGVITNQAVAAGDTIYVHNTHSNQAGAAISWTLPETGSGAGVNIICVDGGDATGASLVDGTVGSITTGAVEATNFNAAFTITGNVFIHGLSIEAGTGASDNNANIVFSGLSPGRIELSDCVLFLDTSNANPRININGQATTGGRFVAKKLSVRFGNASQGLSSSGTMDVDISGLSVGAGSTPTSLFLHNSTIKGEYIVRDSNLSGATNVLNQAGSGSGNYFFRNCVIGTPTTGTHSGLGACQAEFQACAAADATNGADILAYYFENECGTVEDSQTVYLTSGGSQGAQDDGTLTSYSFAMTPSTNCSQFRPLYTPWIAKKVDSTGAKTVTLKVAHTEAAALNKGEIFMEVAYMGEPGLTGTQRVANSPMTCVELDDDCPLMASSLLRDPLTTGTGRTDTAAAWTGITSEITHTLTASVTCDEEGYILCRVGLAKDTTNPVYVDGLIGVA